MCPPHIRLTSSISDFLFACDTFPYFILQKPKPRAQAVNKKRKSGSADPESLSRKQRKKNRKAQMAAFAVKKSKSRTAEAIVDADMGDLKVEPKFKYKDTGLPHGKKAIRSQQTASLANTEPGSARSSAKKKKSKTQNILSKPPKKKKRRMTA